MIVRESINHQELKEAYNQWGVWRCLDKTIRSKEITTTAHNPEEKVQDLDNQNNQDNQNNKERDGMLIFH